ncbi:MAG: adenylate/guanylate cyclase domain-containing response regulator [Leptospiraceae bacterium]|nr:adenylate/guanylate cyclase domain-containing response regulator [Leptospiraceae bacterium]
MQNYNKILIIGSSEEEASEVQDYLKKLDYQVKISLSGSLGMETFNSWKPELVLIDLYLPDIPGIELMRTIKTDPTHENLPILLSSSDDDEEVTVVCLSSGATNFIHKPIRKAELMVKIQSALELVNSRKKLIELNKQLEKERDTAKIAQEIAEQERIKADSLLLNILPVKVANELKQNSKVEPCLYPSATVVFTDFHDFSIITRSLKPWDLVHELDLWFTQFDEIAKKHNLEKLKTIGDSYMCVGGLPEENFSHPLDACLAAIEIQNFMRQNRGFDGEQRRIKWGLRIGIHTGSVIAGVIGKQKFAFDVWGDTVNIASRMEMSCQTGKINVSKETYNFVKYFFNCTNRGFISIKNMGMMETYFLNSIKKKYSLNGEGIYPNDTFWEIYKKLKRGYRIKYRSEVL